MEKAFAAAFEQLNKTGPGLPREPFVDTLLNETSRPTPCSRRDQQVACTLAQWLGSPVGIEWVMRVLAKNKNKIGRPIPEELTSG